MTESFRVATYNIHKCKGLDRRFDPPRIAEVVRELDADIIALQEVLSLETSNPEDDQAGYITSQLPGYTCHFGENRRIRGGAYGNVILSRMPVILVRNYDLTCEGREARGCLRADIVVSRSSLLHMYNVH